MNNQVIPSAHLDIHLEDNEIWNKLKGGDEKAFSILFKRYYNDLVRFGNSYSRHSEKIQDCVQDVFTEIWIYRNTLSDNVMVKAYLFSCVRKRITRIQQRDKVFNNTVSVDEISFLFDFSVEHKLIYDELTARKVAQLNKAVNILPGRQKEALYLRYHNGLNVDQIAEILSVNYQSANNLLHRALLNIRKEWKENLPLLLVLFSYWSNL